MNEQDSFIEVGGRQFLRSKVVARLQLARTESLPEKIHVAHRAVASKLHFQDAKTPDLTWVQMILDTEGPNANNDYMPRPSLMQNYATAIWKPFDMDHAIVEDRSMVGMPKDQPPVRNSIYGVMTHAALSRPDGTLLTDDEIKKLDQSDSMDRDPKDRVCVTAWAALYSFLFPKTVADVVDLIDAGKMHVSMERWIGEWDFLVHDGSEYKALAHAEAVKSGVFAKWATGRANNDMPVLRRSLSFIYGGVASTTNPANKMCKFVSPSMAKAVANHEGDQLLKILMNEHCEVHEAFAVSTGEQQRDLIERHERVTRAIAAITGQLR